MDNFNSASPMTRKQIEDQLKQVWPQFNWQTRINPIDPITPRVMINELVKTEALFHTRKKGFKAWAYRVLGAIFNRPYWTDKGFGHHLEISHIGYQREIALKHYSLVLLPSKLLDFYAGYDPTNDTLYLGRVQESPLDPWSLPFRRNL